MLNRLGIILRLTAALTAAVLSSGQSLMAQSTAFTRTGSLYIVKEVKPPILEIVDLRLEEPSGNNAIDADETCNIILTVRNNGYGDGIGLRGEIKARGTVQGLSYHDKSIPTIRVGQTSDIKFPVKASMNTADGRAEFIVRIDEPLGFGTDSLFLAVDTRAFVQPRVHIVDHSITGADNGSGTLKKMQMFNLQILVQNTEYGDAHDVNVNIVLPDDVYLMDGRDKVPLGELKAGETRSLDYALIVNNLYSSSDIPIHFDITESYGQFAEDGDINLKLDQQFASHKIEIESVAEEKAVITVASLRSDVDRNIPQTGSVNENRFAIVIGNEDYHSYQRSLSEEADVPYAANDAAVFAKYCVDVMGVPQENTVLLTNARWSDMNREISRMTEIVKLHGERSELIFYYAGHGFPDDNTKESYLIPVDISGTDYRSGFKLSDLYSRLTSTGAGKVTVFMDACFSGGGRKAGLLAARGIKVVPKDTPLKGNIVVFSATTADQVALPYNEKQHGMFTYFLLKKIQETAGDCTYSELSDYIDKEVSEYSLRVNYKSQNPETSCSLSVRDEWGEWNFK
ncbi:MAG TPA: caspase family protein [Candidatus Coprenecus stercoravium]|uniref:Caspase family protein n=1 Tax=Candidatus Coprenecus stercoravium TaxID=2840735 RepID=A0A9D2K976_9BACT|nr:caspase family protein [Candidatus Coprenecus stercoravium]